MVLVGTVADSVVVAKGVHRWGAFPYRTVAADDCSHDFQVPVVQVLEVPNLVDMVGVEDIGSVVEVLQHDLACDGLDSHQDHRLRYLVADREVVVVPVGHLVALGHNYPGTAA